MESKKKIKFAVVALSIISIITFSDYAIREVIKKQSQDKEDVLVSEMLNSTDFILDLKKAPQLEYVVGDSLINIHEDNEYYKTFENNNKFEIFIDKKSEEISSIHFIYDVNDTNEEDMKYLKAIFNLSFSNVSNYMLEKTNSTIENMSSSDYISKKSSAISKNGNVSESIIIGKTSEIKITAFYTQNESNKNEVESIDIAILKGNKW
jgi:hypothetical protein